MLPSKSALRRPDLRRAALGLSAVMAITTACRANSPASPSDLASLAQPLAAPSHLKYPANPAIYTVGTTIEDNTPSHKGGAVSSWSIAPALPAGLKFDTATGVVSGTPTVATATKAHTVTATNATGSTTVKLTITVNAPLYVWVPDYYGQVVRLLTGSSTTPVTVELPSDCTPNSVVVNGTHLYVACNAGSGVMGSTSDQLLIYDATTIKAKAAGTTLTPSPTVVTSSKFDSLIGTAFDTAGDLFVTSYGNSEVLEFTAAALALSPVGSPTVALSESPGSPVALAFDTDGSLWVTGQYNGGILLNFTANQLNLANPEDASPRYCMINSSSPTAGCQTAPFLDVEGLALFDGDAWVANNAKGNAGQTPGRELFQISYGNGSTTLVNTYGSSSKAALSPIVCPGGLFGSTEHLWVNDESYGEAHPACGSEGDVAGATGGVFELTLSDLGTTELPDETPVYTDVTGRPGFGGIFIENDG